MDWQKEAGGWRWVASVPSRLQFIYVMDGRLNDVIGTKRSSSAHRRKCFQAGSMASLLRIPVVTKSRISKGVVHDITENVYCHCKPLEDNIQLMVKCRGCEDLYHVECKAVPSRLTKNENKMQEMLISTNPALCIKYNAHSRGACMYRLVCLLTEK